MMRVLLALFLWLLASPVLATELIKANLDSSPSVSGNGGVYTGAISSVTIDVRNGTPSTMFEHVTGAECYGGSGGCARFYPATDVGGSYRGFTPGSYSGGTTQLNMNYVLRWNAAWVSGGGATNLKGNYMTLGGSPFWTQEKSVAAVFGSGFQWGISYSGTLYYIHGNGQSSGTCSSEGYECCPHEANCALGSGVAAAGPFFFGDYTGEWVRVEMELLSSGTWRQYLWTDDDAYNGLYMEATNAPTGTPGITGFSGAYFTDGSAASTSYVMVDDVCFADTFIGEDGCSGAAPGGGGGTKSPTGRMRLRAWHFHPSDFAILAVIPFLRRRS